MPACFHVLATGDRMTAARQFYVSRSSLAIATPSHHRPHEDPCDFTYGSASGYCRWGGGSEERLDLLKEIVEWKDFFAMLVICASVGCEQGLAQEPECEKQYLVTKSSFPPLLRELASALSPSRFSRPRRP
jgi:hypothetical protein